MKAYRVWCVLDEWQELVYAESAQDAKWCVYVEYSSPYNDLLYNDLRARHLPKMDQCAQHHIRIAAIIQAKTITRLSGIFYCRHCGNQNGDGDLCCAECEETPHD
jgi:hypothetical protein